MSDEDIWNGGKNKRSSWGDNNAGYQRVNNNGYPLSSKVGGSDEYSRLSNLIEK